MKMFHADLANLFIYLMSRKHPSDTIKGGKNTLSGHLKVVKTV